MFKFKNFNYWKADLRDLNNFFSKSLKLNLNMKLSKNSDDTKMSKFLISNKLCLKHIQQAGHKSNQSSDPQLTLSVDLFP